MTTEQKPELSPCPFCGHGDPSVPHEDPVVIPPPEPIVPAPVVHLTLTRGYSIACTPDVARISLDPHPVIVEQAHRRLVTCPRCLAILATPAPARPDVAADDSSQRIAAALERIAAVLEDPRQQAEMVAGALGVGRWQR